MPIDHLGAERPVVAVGGVDVKSAARPGTAPARSVGVCYPFLLALRTQPNCSCGMCSYLRCTVMIVVVPAGRRRRQARKARPGGRGPCDGRSAHRAIVAMREQLIAFTWCVLERLLRALGHLHLVAQRTWSPSAVHVSSAVCGKPSSSAEPWRVN